MRRLRITPEVRTARHLFIQLEKLHGFLDTWIGQGDHLQAEVANYLKGHFLSGLVHVIQLIAQNL